MYVANIVTVNTRVFWTNFGIIFFNPTYTRLINYSKIINSTYTLVNLNESIYCTLNLYPNA